MKAFYGSRISDNMTKTPDNFLICHNVPIARTGYYNYTGKEIGLNSDEIVKVYRGPDEVFSKSAIASFEGKITTDDHPPELLNPENSEMYVKGSVQNVRQSKTEPDLLLADLIIYNQRLIDEIENEGKREVSCGYEYNLIDNGDGTYSQVDIVGNHVAVVENGRAGDRVAIMDSKIKEMEGERKKMKIPKQQKGPVTNFFAALGVKHFAKDAEPEEISEALDALAEEREDEKEEPVAEKKEASDDGGNPEIAALSQKFDQLIEAIKQSSQCKEEAKPEDALDAFVESLKNDGDSTGDEENSVTIPAEQMDEDIEEGFELDGDEKPKNPIKGADSAAMIIAINAVKPIIANIKDPKERKVACDSLISQFKKANKSNNKANGYANIINAQKSNAAKQTKQAKDSKAQDFSSMEEMHRKRNPHYKGEK